MPKNICHKIYSPKAKAAQFIRQIDKIREEKFVIPAY